MTMLSNSVAAGDDIQLNPTTLKPVANISPRKPAMLPLEGKYANGLFPERCGPGRHLELSQWIPDRKGLKSGAAF
ncbi:hypothetical protein F8388_001160 [Cannabis sativa]|uniref:Uncharacterized protein n=1 Tax=Cannabis sativa TaxID=3483 RepID=A0A7J6G214_CANSA|nr:hypothetical protein F8388_001160 [Cannabis sativa]KAF4377033.1 hypothetical protein G4B88_023819 [Cannabis sativa]